MSGLKMFIRLLFTIAAICAIASSCEKVIFPPPPQPDTNTYISFDTIIKPIFTADGCTGCHKAGAYNPDLKTDPYHDLVIGPLSGTHVGTPYLVKGDSIVPENSEFYQWITNDVAHRNRMSDIQRTNIHLWIKQGFKNN